MPYANPVKRKEAIANWFIAHPEYRKEQRLKDPAKAREAVKRSNQKLKLEVLAHYGAYCHCPGGCCESTLEFLGMDHIDGGGTKHRKEIGTNIYRWLKKHNYPSNFRVLCHNCNMAIGFWGRCPHER